MMIVNDELSKLYPCFDRDIKDISEIVIHGTGGGVNAISLLRWMITGGRVEEYKRGIGLFHYLIDRDGEIYKLYSLEKWMYHSSSGQHDKCTVGIELMNPSTNNQVEYTAEQYRSLAELVKAVNGLVTIKSIVGHGLNKQKYSGSYKVCPGRFDWFNFGETLDGMGMSFTAAGEALHADPV